MRRRSLEVLMNVPERLMCYDPPTKDAAEWEAGLERFNAARERWAREHRVDEDDMPWPWIGDAPFDASLV